MKFRHSERDLIGLVRYGGPPEIIDLVLDLVDLREYYSGVERVKQELHNIMCSKQENYESYPPDRETDVYSCVLAWLRGEDTWVTTEERHNES